VYVSSKIEAFSKFERFFPSKICRPTVLEPGNSDARTISDEDSPWQVTDASDVTIIDIRRYYSHVYDYNQPNG
jgi:hypothetical protein